MNRRYNGHPDASGFNYDLSKTEDVAIFGQARAGADYQTDHLGRAHPGLSLMRCEFARTYVAHLTLRAPIARARAVSLPRATRATLRWTLQGFSCVRLMTWPEQTWRCGPPLVICSHFAPF